MPAPTVPDKDFVELLNRIGSPAALAKHLGIQERGVQARMNRLEEKGFRFELKDKRSPRFTPDPNPARLQHEIHSGTVMVGSDCHYFPGEATRAHKAFVRLCRELKPKVVVMNGDIFDGSTIS